MRGTKAPSRGTCLLPRGEALLKLVRVLVLILTMVADRRRRKA
jgi:hypothetical protein